MKSIDLIRERLNDFMGSMKGSTCQHQRVQVHALCPLRELIIKETIILN